MSLGSVCLISIEGSLNQFAGSSFVSFGFKPGSAFNTAVLQVLFPEVVVLFKAFVLIRVNA